MSASKNTTPYPDFVIVLSKDVVVGPGQRVLPVNRSSSLELMKSSQPSRSSLYVS